jgi:hypothetical protein
MQRSGGAVKIVSMADYARQQSELRKGAPYIGPRGGKWADPQHTISWKEGSGEKRHEKLFRKRVERLMKKVERRGPGEGAEVQLTKAELNYLLSSGKFALVSAGANPEYAAHKGMTRQEEAKRHRALKSDLVKGGFMHTEVAGHYGGEEASFLVMVHDAEPTAIRNLGQKYQQDSVIYSKGGKNQLFYTYGDKAGEDLCSDGKGWAAKPDADDYYSVVKHPDGTRTKFALNINFGETHRCEKAMQHTLHKAGPYYGPRGGKYADPQHTISWRESKKRASKPKQEPKSEDLPRVNAIKYKGQAAELFRVSSKLKFGKEDVSAIQGWYDLPEEGDQWRRIRAIRDESAKRNPQGPAARLAKLITQAETIPRKPVTLYRGLEVSQALAKKLASAKTFSDAAISSWTANPNDALDHSYYGNMESDINNPVSVVLKVTTKKGLPLNSMLQKMKGWHKGHQDSETMLRGTKAKVVGVTKWYPYGPSGEEPTLLIELEVAS